MLIQADGHNWLLECDHSAYALGLNRAGLVTHRYWGARLSRAGDYPDAPDPMPRASFDMTAHLTPEEYPGYGEMKFTDPCLKASFADGVRDVVLRLAAADVIPEGDTSRLDVKLCDAYYPFRVTLHYRVHAAYDLIERWVTVHNAGETPVRLERVWSAQWHLPPGKPYWLTHLTGRWADEMHLNHEALHYGIKVLESRRLTTSHQHNPWFALDCGNADEESGEVWFGALAWSGNWKLSAEVTDFGATQLSIGLNDWDFVWELNPGESFTTPSCYAGYTRQGFGAASRTLHDFIRDRLLPHGSMPHKVLYNSWEATFFNVDEHSQGKLAEAAASLGVELFVVDDGWFHRRNSDDAGLGDWWPDDQKFPHGLQSLIDRVNGLGMDFGLWIEPEMVNPDSDLYRAHPDWVLHFPTRTRTTARNQLILNLGRAVVQAYLVSQIDKLLSENNIAFIKWDMNRNVGESGWPDAPFDQRELWVRYVQGLYAVWETLRQRHPQVIWQSCSGGGGRADLGILRLADQIWVSDNTEATARLCIQHGFSFVFPANTMEAWVTDAGQDFLSLEFRFHVSMCGALGVGGHLLRWTDAQRAQAARLIALYKDIRPVVQGGDLYRLHSPLDSAFSAVQYLSKDRAEGVLFAFRTYSPDPVQSFSLHLRGLEAGAYYEVEGVPGIRSGLALMQDGLRVELGNFQSALRRIRRSQGT
jgi:alpha-galactosidase